MQEAFQNHGTSLPVSPADVSGYRGRKTPAACLRGLGTMFPGKPPSAQPMVLTSPTEHWEGASFWPPTISLLLGFSSTNHQ